MLRPFHIWLLFLLGLALVLPPMGWLTVKALELDRAELAARQQVELEEKVSRALWRMDVFLSPLLAQEAARPEFLYKPVLATLPAGKGKSAGERTLSPLLAEPPEFVLLNFELAENGTLTSPQSPCGPDEAWARSNGAPAAKMDAATKRLKELSGNLSHADLLARLPEQMVPQVAWLANEGKLGQNLYGNTIVGNTYEVPQTQPQNASRMPTRRGPSQAQEEAPN